MQDHSTCTEGAMLCLSLMEGWKEEALHQKGFQGSTKTQKHGSRECCEGMLDATWKNDKPMTMKQFRRRLSLQMCEYRSYREEYPGDEFLHTTTIQEKKSCGKKRKVSLAQEGTIQYEVGLTYQQYVEQLGEMTPGVPKRFCNDAVGSFKSHFHGMIYCKSGVLCAVSVCGKGGAYWTCGICNKDLHWTDPADKSVKRGSKGQKQNMVDVAVEDGVEDGKTEE